LVDQGLLTKEKMLAMMAPFPIAGPASYIDDYGFPRVTPAPHPHAGNDIFADFGTPIVSSGPGVVKAAGSHVVGGLSIWIQLDDGTGLYYAHLQAFADGLTAGQRVDKGTLLGQVGNTGDAMGGAPHLHFEFHPPLVDPKGQTTASGVTAFGDGKTANTNTPDTDPKPHLDGWLTQAEQAAEAYVASLTQQVAEIPREAHVARRVSELFNIEDAARSDHSSDLLWFSSGTPALGTLGLAREAAGETRLNPIAGSISESYAEQQRLAAVRQAVQTPQIELANISGVPFVDLDSGY